MARTFALLLAVCASCAAFHAPVSKAAAPQLRAAPGPAAVAAAAATTLVPQMASAEVGFTDEALGVFLGILPLALIARRRRGTSARAPFPDAAPPSQAVVVGGGAFSLFGGAIERATLLKRNLNIEYSPQKRFAPKDYL